MAASSFFAATSRSEAGTRSIPLLEDVRKAFLLLKEDRIASGMCETVVDGVQDFVFTNSINGLITPATINRAIDGIIKSYNKEECEKKGYKWNEISITRWMNFYTHLFEIKLDGKFVEVYNTKTGTFDD